MSPRVTFVLVTYGGRDLVVSCLDKLAEHTKEPYDVVIVDSASPDGTGDWLAEHLTDVKVVRMPDNRGFGAGSNLGVRHARTEFVCFLNADVEVTDGWLAPLLDFLDTTPKAAAVAPVMLHPDGTVQEAGSVIGGDGWCRAWAGERKDLYDREVDYASAACLLVRRAAFHRAGGFSAEYEIAYFEDVDLAMALREQGGQTWLCTASAVTHIRHGSSSSDRAAELMRLNRGVFTRRWPAQLAARVPTEGLEQHKHRWTMLRDHLAPFRVVIIDDRVPQADRGAGDPRTLAVLDAWRAADDRAVITYFSALTDRAEDYAPALRQQGIEVVWGVDPAEWSRSRTGQYDVIAAFRPHNLDRAAIPIAAAQPQAVRVYDSEALFHRRPEQHFDATTDSAKRRAFAAESAMYRDMEVRAFNWADVGVCVTEEEARWARRVAPDTSVHVVGFPVRVPDSVPGWDERDGIMFFGGFNGNPGSPNEFAVLELAEHVMPALRSRQPGVRLRIVGSDPSPAVLALQSGDIEVLGTVPDPQPVLGAGLVQVVPMRFGAGVKLKFIDSMAAGLPFVTTSVGAEGLHLDWTRKHLVGDSPVEIVELVDRLLGDRPLWTEIQQALLESCRTHFSRKVFTDAMNRVLVDCGIPPTSVARHPNA